MAVPLRVVDTSAWIEWLTGSALGKKLGRELPEKAYGVVLTDRAARTVEMAGAQNRRGAG